MSFADRTYYWFRHQFEASYTKRILIESLDLLNMLWPYLVGGIILSTVIYLYLSKQRVARFFSNRGQHVSILLAASIGVVSPLGSYVLIPLSAALLVIGVPLPVLMALMVSSPLINPNLFLLTVGAMGMEMGLMRVFSAFVLGVAAGYLTQISIRRNWIDPNQIIKEQSSYSLSQFPVQEQKKTIRLFLVELWKMTRWIGRYFFLAIALAAAMKILINPAFFLKFFSHNQFLTLLFSTAAGIPFYVCGGAAIPVVQQLAEFGLSNGAVLAFFISGPVTKISNLVLIQAAFKRKILVIYLVIGIGGAMLLGLLYNMLSRG